MEVCASKLDLVYVRKGKEIKFTDQNTKSPIFFEDTIKVVKDKIYDNLEGAPNFPSFVSSWVNVIEYSSFKKTKETKRLYLSVKEHDELPITRIIKNGVFEENVIYFEFLADHLSSSSSKDKILEKYNDLSSFQYDEIQRSLNQTKRSLKDIINVLNKVEGSQKTKDKEKTTTRQILPKTHNKILSSSSSLFQQQNPRYSITNSLVGIFEKKENSKNKSNKINLLTLFKIIEVDETIPYVSIDTEDKGEPPYIKIAEHLRPNKELLERWVFSTTFSDKGVRKVKKPKGLSIRFCLDENDTNYHLISLFEDGRMFIRYSWSLFHQIDIEKYNETLYKTNEEVIKKLNKYKVAFLNDKDENKNQIPFIDSNTLEIYSLDASMIIPNEELDKNGFYRQIMTNSVSKKYFKGIEIKKLKDQLCRELGINEKDCKSQKIKQLKDLAQSRGISLNAEETYSPSCSRLVVKYQPIKITSKKLNKTKINELQGLVAKNQNDLMNLVDKLEEDTGEKSNQMKNSLFITISKVEKEEAFNTILSIRNSNSFQELGYLFGFLIKYFSYFKLFKKDEEKQPKKGKLAKTKIDVLKQYNIKTNARTCQLTRQPDVFETLDMDEETKSNLKYTLKVSGTELVCMNPKYPYPGFLSDGTPCCFTKDQRSSRNYLQIIDVEKLKSIDNVGNLSREQTINVINNTMNVLKTPKLLDPNKLGILPDKINTLFKGFFEMKSDKKSKKEKIYGVFKIGVYQDTYSYIYGLAKILLLEVGKNPSIQDFQQMVLSTLHKSSDAFFYKLVGGEVSREFKTKKKYRDYILSLFIDNRNFIDHRLINELMGEAIGYNIVVFEEQSQNIICGSGSFIDPNKDFVFLIKKEFHYEPVILIDKKGGIKSTFEVNTEFGKTMGQLIEYSCEIQENETTSKEFLNYKRNSAKNTFVNLLKNKEVSIDYQIINVYSKVIYLIVSGIYIVPVEPVSVFNTDIPTMRIETVDEISKLVKSFQEQQIQTQEQFYEFYSKFIKNKIVSKVVENGVLVGFVLESGHVIPNVLFEDGSLFANEITHLPFSRLNFDLDLDAFIMRGETIYDNRMKIVSQIKYNKGLLNQLRYDISNAEEFSSQMRNEVKNVILDPTTSEKSKRNYVKEIVKKLIDEMSIIEKVDFSKKNVYNFSNEKSCRNISGEEGLPYCKNNKVLFISNKDKEKMIDQIVYEIVKDTVAQKILRKIVSLRYNENSNDFIQKPGEILLVDLSKIKRFFN